MMKMMKKTFDRMKAACCLAAAVCCLASCDEGPEVQQEYPFTVEALPVTDELMEGETAEIRLEIIPEGEFNGTVYTLRYFQPDGEGILQLADGTALKPNDRYLLEDLKFRLYYTSESSDEAQAIDLYFENNWGAVCQLSFSFNAEDSNPEESVTEPVGTGTENGEEGTE